MRKKSSRFETAPLEEVLKKLDPASSAGTVERIVHKQEPYAVRAVEEALQHLPHRHSAKTNG